MRFELRKVGNEQLALAVVGGDLVPGQKRCKVTINSEATSITEVELTLQMGLGLNFQDHEPVANDLKKAFEAFGNLSPANRKRFATALFDELYEALER